MKNLAEASPDVVKRLEKLHSEWLEDLKK